MTSADAAVGLHFVSFGSDWRYRALARLTLHQLAGLYPTATQRVWQPRDLDQAVKRQALRYPRGFGLWVWKPYVVFRSLAEVEAGDIVIYVDGRSSVPKQPVHWLARMVQDPAIEVAAWQMHHSETSWSRRELLQEFGVDRFDAAARSGQFAAGILAVRKSVGGSSLADAWLEFMLSRPDLYDDHGSSALQDSSFIESRHDQSVLSLLLKTRVNSGLRLLTLTDEDIYSPTSIRPHGKQHPSRWFPLREIGRVAKHLVT